MRAVVIAIKENRAAVALEGGTFRYIDNDDYEIGQILELSDDAFVGEDTEEKEQSNVNNKHDFRDGLSKGRRGMFRVLPNIAAAAILLLVTGAASISSMAAYTVTIDGEEPVELKVNLFDRVVGTNMEDSASLQFSKLPEAFETVLLTKEESAGEEQIIVSTSIAPSSYMSERKLEGVERKLNRAVDHINEERKESRIVLDITDEIPEKNPGTADEPVGDAGTSETPDTSEKGVQEEGKEVPPQNEEKELPAQNEGNEAPVQEESTAPDNMTGDGPEKTDGNESANPANDEHPDGTRDNDERANGQNGDMNPPPPPQENGEKNPSSQQRTGETKPSSRQDTGDNYQAPPPDNGENITPPPSETGENHPAPPQNGDAKEIWQSDNSTPENGMAPPDNYSPDSGQAMPPAEGGPASNPAPPPDGGNH